MNDSNDTNTETDDEFDLDEGAIILKTREEIELMRESAQIARAESSASVASTERDACSGEMPP